MSLRTCTHLHTSTSKILTHVHPRSLPGTLRLPHTLTLRSSQRNSSSSSSSSHGANPEPRGPRISTLFTGLLALGIGTTSYGLYEFYTSLTMWPPELRNDLRSGIKAKNQGNLVTSEKFIRRAYETSQTLPLTLLSPSPYLKISGIAILLGSVLESDNRPSEAYDVYSTALKDLQQIISPHVDVDADANTGPLPSQPTPTYSVDSNSPTQTETEIREIRLRAIALSYKLGEMAETYNLGDEVEEGWLTWAVEQVVLAIRDQSSPDPSPTPQPTQLSTDTSTSETQSHLTSLNLPQWLTKTDLGAPIEALGAFYARVGKWAYAYTLYTSALTILLPDGQDMKHVTDEDICRAAQIMSNISNAVLHAPSPHAQNLEVAEGWARRAKDLIMDGPEGKRRESVEICGMALCAALFNLGMLREMSADSQAARELYRESLQQSQNVGMVEGVREAKAALRRLEKSGSRDEGGEK